MRASRDAAFARCVPDMIVYIDPLTFWDPAVVSYMHVQDVPSSLFKPITIQVYDHDAMTGPYNKAWRRGSHPSGSHTTTRFITRGCKIEGSQWAVMFPSGVWPSGE